MKISQRTTWTVNDGTEDFPARFEPANDNDFLTHVKENRAVVGYLTPDPEPGGYYWTENDCGEYLNFNRRTIHSRDFIEFDELQDLVRKSPGRVFWIACYEHSAVRFYRSGNAIGEHPTRPSTAPALETLHIPDQQWDVSTAIAIYVAPDDTPDPAAYCDGQMEAWSDWCNGSIYGVVVMTLERETEDDDWNEVDSDECWGYIGYTHALASLKETFEYHRDQ